MSPYLQVNLGDAIGWGLNACIVAFICGMVFGALKTFKIMDRK